MLLHIRFDRPALFLFRCGKQIMDRLGIRQLHVVMTDLSVEKGRTVITADVIENVTAKTRTLIYEELNHVE